MKIYLVGNTFSIINKFHRGRKTLFRDGIMSILAPWKEIESRAKSFFHKKYYFPTQLKSINVTMT